jgi:hypothetical protein
MTTETNPAVTTAEQNGFKVMTVMLPRGEALPLAKVLFEQYGLEALQIYNGRGQHGEMGKKQWNEVDVLTVVVPASQAETVFQWLYDLAEIDVKPNRFLTQAALEKSTAFLLPEPAEPQKAENAE